MYSQHAVCFLVAAADGKEIVADTHLDAVCLSGEHCDRRILRLPSKAAIAVLEVTRQLDGRDFDIPRYRGEVYLAANQPAAAELEFRKTLQHLGRDPSSADYPVRARAGKSTPSAGKGRGSDCRV